MQQQQRITLPDCTRLLLKSDGTKRGTTINNEGLANERTCPDTLATQSAAAGSDGAESFSSTSRPKPVATNAVQVQLSNKSPRKNSPNVFVVITYLLCFALWLPAVSALSGPQKGDEVASE